MELENQVVGPETRDVELGIPALEWVVKIVRQENRLQPGGFPDLAVPLLAMAIAEGTVVKVVDRLGINAIVGKTVEGLDDFQQPGELDRVIDPVEKLGQVERSCPRIEVRTDLLSRHPGGVCEFGIVMVSQNLVEVASRRTMRVNM